MSLLDRRATASDFVIDRLMTWGVVRESAKALAAESVAKVREALHLGDDDKADQ